MALPPQGLFSFPGIIAPLSGRYLCSHGVDPGRIIIKAAYQDTPVLEYGDMIISYGNQSFPVRDCKVIEQVNYFDSADGWVSEYTLLDRRWRWRFSEIEGNYNFKLASGKRDPDCTRSPHQLAQLLLAAMKEQKYDYSQLPNGPRPEVLWLGANPALELQKLADDLGCSFIYDPLSDFVLIRTTGQGAQLPNLPSVDQIGSNQVKPITPSGIRLVGGETRVQMAVPLTPLAEDTDGELKEPRDLSYVAALASDTGQIEETWYYTEDDDFSNVTDEKQRKLLQKTMWKYWKLGDVRSQLLQYFNVPQLRIENVSLELNESYVDENKEYSKTGFVVGIFNLKDEQPDLFGQGPGKSENTSKDRKDVIYKDGVQIVNNHDFPYLILGRPIWKWTDDGEKRIPDELWVICTFTVRNSTPEQTCSLHHYNFYRQLTNDPLVGPEIYHDDSFVLRATLQFNTDDLEHGTVVIDNKFRDELETLAIKITESRAQRYQNIQAGNAVYKQFILVNLDGALRSVVWSFDESAAITEVYRNSEPDFVETKYDRRLQFSEIKRKAGVP